MDIPDALMPGVISRSGFLGGDVRAFDQIVADDAAELARLNLDAARLADELDRICKTAMNSCGNSVKLSRHQRAIFREARGMIPCPWGGCGSFYKGEVEMVSDATGQKMLFTPLSIHLIREHGFLQGRGTRYRIEPKDAATLLGL